MPYVPTIFTNVPTTDPLDTKIISPDILTLEQGAIIPPGFTGLVSDALETESGFNIEVEGPGAAS